jgi:hypothetical protein
MVPCPEIQKIARSVMAFLLGRNDLKTLDKPSFLFQNIETMLIGENHDVLVLIKDEFIFEEIFSKASSRNRFRHNNPPGKKKTYRPCELSRSSTLTESASA